MRNLKITKQITDRSSKTIDQYLSEIASIPIITAEEEALLAIKMSQGDKKSADKLVTSNLRFAVSVAKQYMNKGVPLGDLINEANQGLIKAATKFDHTKGFKFISYAVWWIRQYTNNAIIDQGKTIRLPTNKSNTLRLYTKSVSELQQILNREPTISDLVEYTNLSLLEIKELQCLSERMLSLDAPLSTEENCDGSLCDVIENIESISPMDNINKQSLKYDVMLAIKTLPQKEQNVLKFCYGIGVDRAYTTEELSDIFAISSERIRQIKKKAVRRLSSKSGVRKLLVGYLD